MGALGAPRVVGTLLGHQGVSGVYWGACRDSQYLGTRRV